MTLMWNLAVVVLFLIVLFLIVLLLLAGRLAGRNFLITTMDLATARIINRFGRLHHIIALDERGNSVRWDAQGRLVNEDGLHNTILGLNTGEVGVTDPYGNQVIRYPDGRFQARDARGNELSYYPSGEWRMLNVNNEELWLTLGPPPAAGQAPSLSIVVHNAAGVEIPIENSGFRGVEQPDQTLMLRVVDGMMVYEQKGGEPLVLDADRRPIPTNAHRSVLLDEVYAPSRNPWLRWTRHLPLFGGYYWIGLPLIDRVRWLTSEEYEHDEEHGEGAMVAIRIDQLSLRDQYVEFDSQTLQTSDGAQAIVKGNLHFRIVDPYKAVVNVDNFVGALRDRYNGMVRTIVGQLSVKDLNKLRTGGPGTIKAIQDEIEELRKVAYERWGILVLSVGFEDVTPEDPDVIKALAQEAVAAAQAKATEIQAGGEAKAQRLKGEAARDVRKYQAEGDREYFDSVFSAVAANLEGGVEMYKIYQIAQAALGPANTIVLNTDILRSLEGFRGGASPLDRDALSQLALREILPRIGQALKQGGMDPKQVNAMMQQVRRSMLGGGTTASGGVS